MTRTPLISLVLCLTLVGGLSAWGLAHAAGERSNTAAAVSRLVHDVVRLQQDVARTRSEQEVLSSERTRLRLELDALASRLESERQLLASAPTGSAQVGAADSEATGAAGKSAPPVAEADAAAEGATLQAEFQALLAAGVLDEGASREQQERFWELCRTTPVLAELIAALEARIAADPGDVEARMDLAEACVAKLLTVPGGPERGLWSERAEEQWRAIASSDPAHWEARFALGENYSYYPPFMDKAGEAISWLSEARAIQERLPPQPGFAQTYLLLSRVQLQQGDASAARATLQDGLRLHPNDAELLAALESLP